jgi:hypothetical protein
MTDTETVYLEPFTTLSCGSPRNWPARPEIAPTPLRLRNRYAAEMARDNDKVLAGSRLRQSGLLGPPTGVLYISAPPAASHRIALL